MRVPDEGDVYAILKYLATVLARSRKGHSHTS